jgi:hypothetical protein
MGLDMYLEKAKKQENKTFKEVTKRIENLSYEMWKSSREEVMYWRKANQIHNWFVLNIQNGIDDCGNYEITKEALETLLQQCKLVDEEFKKAIKVEGMVKNGATYSREKGKWEDIMEKGIVFENLDTEKILELLPPTSGFFFGNTDINQWYYAQIIETIKSLEKALKETDFENYHVWYNSSW